MVARFGLLAALLLLSMISLDAEARVIGVAGWGMRGRQGQRKPWERTPIESWRYFKSRWEEKHKPWVPTYGDEDGLFNYGSETGLPEPCVGLCYHMRKAQARARQNNENYE